MKIVVRIRGGLGNQLFQYAFALKLMNLYNANEIILDIRSYKKYKIRAFQLDEFQLNPKVKISNENEFNIFYDISMKIFHIFQAVFYKLSGEQLDFLFPFLSKMGLYYSGRTIKKIPFVCNKKIIYVYGYFQDTNCLDEIEKLIIKELKLKAEYSDKFKYYSNKIINSSHSIAVSIRCGKDYLKGKWPICDSNYYNLSIDRLKKGYQNSKICLFADDSNKAKEILGYRNDIEFIEKLEPVEQLLLMSLCEDFVISNSSFSWWGAYLASSKKKRVIMPKMWYPKIKTEETKLIYKNVEVS